MTVKPVETLTSPFPFEFPDALANVQRYWMAVPHLNAIGAKAILSQQLEALSFFKRRCEQDLALFNRISEAKDAKDVQQALLGFYEGAAREYAEEAEKAAEKGSRIATDVMEGLRHEGENWKEAAAA